jgi:VCBS repeat-containing protein
LELENLLLAELWTESLDFASGGSVIRLPNGVGDGVQGTATGTFGGTAGRYTVTLGYFDEDDGDATVEVSIGGVSLGPVVLDQGRASGMASPDNFTELTLTTDLDIAAGAAVAVVITKDAGEVGRLDYLDFAPVDGTGDPPPANVPPTAVDDAATVVEDTTLEATGNVLTNDGDGGDGPAALGVVTAGTLAGSYGSLALAADGGWTYTLDNALAAVQALNTGDTLVDSFAYTVSDGADTAQATLAVTIEGVDEPTDPEPDPEPGTGTPFRLEAETLALTDLWTESLDFASGSSVIRLPNGVGDGVQGTATGTFGGTAGRYTVTLGYFDEDDGDATVEISIGGVSLGPVVLDQGRASGMASPDNFTELTLTTDFDIAAGAAVAVVITKDAGEVGRLDYLDFAPVDGTGDPPPAGLEVFFPFAGQSNARNYFANSRNGNDSTGIDRFVQDYQALTGATAVHTLNTAVGASAAERDATGSTTSTNYWWDLDAGTPGPRLTAAIDAILATGRTPDGLVWAQGEQDGVGIANGWTTVDRYVQATEAIFAHLRDALGVPDLAIYVQQIGTDTDPAEAAGYHQIRRAQAEIAEADPNAHLAVLSYDQPLTDSVHFTPDGYAELAARLARFVADHRGEADLDGTVGPKLADIALDAGRDVVLTIGHDGGADLSAGGYDGFTVRDAAGDTVDVVSADRTGAATIRLDLADDPGLRFTVSYVNGSDGWSTDAVVRDDADPLAMPLHPVDRDLVWGTDADDLVVVDVDTNRLFKAIGGAGTDTLQAAGRDLAFDLTGADAADRFDFERLDLAGGGNGVAIDEAYLAGRAADGATGFTVDGTAADSAALDLGAFAFAGTDGGYDLYAADGFTLRIDSAIADDVLIA